MKTDSFNTFYMTAKIEESWMCYTSKLRVV
jgi:hypothetical protein